MFRAKDNNAKPAKYTALQAGMKTKTTWIKAKKLLNPPKTKRYLNSTTIIRRSEVVPWD